MKNIAILDHFESEDELKQRFYDMGLKRNYTPCLDGEPSHYAILFKTKKPFKIIDGLAEGAECDVFDHTTVRIWTSQKKKALSFSKQYNLRIRRFDREAELFVPAALADAILPKFGVQARRSVAKASKKAGSENLLKALISNLTPR